MSRSKRKRQAAEAAIEEQITTTSILWWRLPHIDEQGFDANGWHHTLVGLTGSALQAGTDPRHSSADHRRHYADGRVVHDLMHIDGHELDPVRTMIIRLCHTPRLAAARLAFYAGLAGEPDAFLDSHQLDREEYRDFKKLGEDLRSYAVRKGCKISVGL